MAAIFDVVRAFGAVRPARARRTSSSTRSSAPARRSNHRREKCQLYGRTSLSGQSQTNANAQICDSSMTVYFSGTRENRRDSRRAAGAAAKKKSNDGCGQQGRGGKLSAASSERAPRIDRPARRHSRTLRHDGWSHHRVRAQFAVHVRRRGSGGCVRRDRSREGVLHHRRQGQRRAEQGVRVRSGFSGRRCRCRRRRRRGRVRRRRRRSRRRVPPCRIARRGRRASASRRRWSPVDRPP